MAGILQRARSGFTLVELLVALVIGSGLSLAASTFLLYSKRAFVQDQEALRMQENGRYALRLLSRELRMAGFAGVAAGQRQPVPSLTGSPCFDVLLDMTAGLVHLDDVDRLGHPTTGGDALPDDCLPATGLVASSDVLVVRRVMDRPHRRNSETFQVPAKGEVFLQLPPDDGLPVLDYHRAGVRSGWDLWRYHPQVFFIRNYSLAVGDNIPVLCRRRLSPTRAALAPTECLVEGVEQLQLEFVLDKDGDDQADATAQAPGPEDLERAVAVRIALMMRSVGQVADRDLPRDMSFAGRRVSHADRHLRLALESSVLLRNVRVQAL